MGDDITKMLRYNHVTGEIVRVSSRTNKKYEGKVAGHLRSDGYVRVYVAGKNLMAHRIAWFLFFGRWPEKQIDHVNGVRSDNRICNLREATDSQNAHNRKKPITNTSGYKGVHLHKQTRRYQARIRIDGKQTSLGLFDDPFDAHIAYCHAAKRVYGEFSNTGILNTKRNQDR